MTRWSLENEPAIEEIHKKPGREEQHSDGHHVALSKKVFRIVRVNQHPTRDRIQQRSRDARPQTEPKYGLGDSGYERTIGHEPSMPQ